MDNLNDALGPNSIKARDSYTSLKTINKVNKLLGGGSGRIINTRGNKAMDIYSRVSAGTIGKGAMNYRGNTINKAINIYSKVFAGTIGKGVMNNKGNSINRSFIYGRINIMNSSGGNFTRALSNSTMDSGGINIINSPSRNFIKALSNRAIDSEGINIMNSPNRNFIRVPGNSLDNIVTNFSIYFLYPIDLNIFG